MAHQFGIPEDPCWECKHRYIEDIWIDDMCDKVKEHLKNEKCSYLKRINKINNFYWRIV